MTDNAGFTHAPEDDDGDVTNSKQTEATIHVIEPRVPRDDVKMEAEEPDRGERIKNINYNN